MGNGNSVMDRVVNDLARPSIRDLVNEYAVADRTIPTSYDGTTLEIARDIREALKQELGLTDAHLDQLRAAL